MSSSSSSPPPLTQEAISRMPADELIALVDDDERMVEVIQDRFLKKKLRSRIMQLGDEESLLPDEDEDANDAFTDKLLHKILNFKDTATHFAQHPATILTTRAGSTLKRIREDAENEDDLDYEDSNDGGTKRVAESQASAEGSAQGETPRGRKKPSSQETKAADTQRNSTVLTSFRLGPNLKTPNMRTIMGGEAVGYPDIMINGVSSFVKTTYALQDSAYTLEHEGKMYASLHTLQGDILPRVTACGRDVILNLVIFATEQCGQSLRYLTKKEIREYGGLKELYWKAALALEKIHSAGFIHGDVSWHNIVVDDASNVRFIDLKHSKKSRSETLRQEDFDLLADAFDIDPASDFRTLSRTKITEAHLESREIV